MNPHSFAAWRTCGPTTPRRVAAGLLASLVLTVVCLALAPSASAALPNNFVGTQSWEDPTARQMRQLGNADAKVFRVQLSWASVEPNRPTGCQSGRRCVHHDYRWGRYDQMFERAAKGGVRLVPVLLGSPSWAAPRQQWVPTPGKPGYRKWKRTSFYDFAREAAKRYGRNGIFWQEQEEQGKNYPMSVRARYWQIWNEPTLGRSYWWNDLSSRVASEYAQLLNQTSTALKNGDSSALTITAGLPWSNQARYQPPQFLRMLFKRGARADYIAIHPYARTPDLVIEGVRQARAALNGTSARSKPIWLTEFGWASSGPRDPFTVSESTQARYLRETYRKLLAVRAPYGVHGAIWFNLIDRRPSPGYSDAWYYHTGLFRRDGVSRKTAWKALKCVTGTGTCRY